MIGGGYLLSLHNLERNVYIEFCCWEVMRRESDYFIFSMLIIAVIIILFIYAPNFRVFITGQDVGSGTFSPSLGQVAFWSFNETSWTGFPFEVRDGIGSAHGSVYGGARIVPEGIGGRSGGFDGVDDYVTINDQPSIDIGRGNFSLSFWIKGTFAGGQKVFAKADIDTNNTGYGVQVMGNALNMKISNGTNSTGLSIENVSDGNWHHIVFVVDRERNSYGYIDNARADSLSGGIFPGKDLSNQNPLIIGGNLGAAGAEKFFGGFIDEVHIYNTALSSLEIRQINLNEAANFSAAPVSPTLSSLYLVGRYLLNESGWSNAGADVRDATGTSPFGVARNGANVSLVESVRAGSFDGVDDVVEIASTNGFDTPSFTIAAWVYPSQAAQHGGIFEKTIGGTTNSHYLLFADINNYKFRIKQANGVLASVSSSGIASGSWTYLAGTFNGSQATLYRNGAVADTLMTSGIARGAGASYIGNLGSAAGSFNGSISDVRIYNTSLSAENISTLYQESLVSYGLASGPLYSISVDNCRIISESGRYLLTRDITVNNETCFTISADSVILDGQGYAISANVSIDPLTISSIGAYGIRAAGRKNITVRNIDLNEFQHGILFANINNSLVEEVSVSSSMWYGLLLNRSIYNTIRSSFFIGNNDGVILINSSNNTISSSELLANSNYGLSLLQYSKNNVISSTYFGDNGFGAIYNDTTSTGNRFSSLSFEAPFDSSPSAIIEPLQLNRGYSAFVRVGDFLSFRLLGRIHNLSVSAIVNNRVLLIIRSQPLNITLSPGENKSIDVSGNGFNDLIIQLKRILSDGRAEIKMTSLRETNVPSTGLDTGGAVGAGGGNQLLNGSRGQGQSQPINITQETSTTDIVLYVLGGLIVVILLILIGWFIWLNYSSKQQPFLPHEDRLFKPDPYSNILQR